MENKAATTGNGINNNDVDVNVEEDANQASPGRVNASTPSRSRTSSMSTQPSPQEAQQIARSQTPVVLGPQRLHGILTHLATLSILGIFSFLGLLARLGLTAINTYNGEIVFPLIYAQMVGCVAMGVVSTRRKQLQELYTPLYVGLGTGLCGSITTFSSWMLGVFEGFAQISRPAHGGFYNFMDGLSQTIITLGGSVAALTFGAHIAHILLPAFLLSYLARREGDSETSTSDEKQLHPSKKHQKEPFTPQYSPLLQASLIALFVLLWLATILICIYVPKWRGIVMFSLIFAPIGVWIRFYLSRLNPLFTTFPLGTFLANMLGTAILAACVALQMTGNRTRLQCQVLQGIDDGFCGCLTTVSTFVVEISKLQRGKTYKYVAASWVGGQLLMLVILGSTDFARGGLQAKCAI